MRLAILLACIGLFAEYSQAHSNVLYIGRTPGAAGQGVPTSDAMEVPPGEPGNPGQPQPELPWGTCILKYGIVGPTVGQGLTLDYVAMPGGKGSSGALKVTGGQPQSAVSLFIGQRPAYIPLPWGDAFRVEPELIVPIGQFDQEGEVVFPFDLRNPALAGMNIYIQAVEVLYIDLYPWTLHTSWGLSMHIFDTAALQLPTSQEFSWGMMSVDARLEIMESNPPQYAVTLTANVPGTGYSLDHVRTAWSKEGKVDVYFTMTEPGEGDQVQVEPETHRSRVYLGEGLECWDVAIHMNRVVSGRQYLLPPPYLLLEQFEVPCPPVNQR